MSDSNDIIYIFNEETEGIEKYRLLYRNKDQYVLLDPENNSISLSSNEHLIGSSETEVLRKWSKKIFQEIAEINEELRLLDRKD